MRFTLLLKITFLGGGLSTILSSSGCDLKGPSLKYLNTVYLKVKKDSIFQIVCVQNHSPKPRIYIWLI